MVQGQRRNILWGLLTYIQCVYYSYIDIDISGRGFKNKLQV